MPIDRIEAAARLVAQRFPIFTWDQIMAATALVWRDSASARQIARDAYMALQQAE